MTMKRFTANIEPQDGGYSVVKDGGTDHLVVPVIMMVEGVHSGSQGAILYTEEELAKDVSAWDGSPVVINHPTNSSGDFISAADPGVDVIGILKNTHMEDGKLKSEAWMKIDDLKIASEETYESLLSEHAIDVSVGVFSDTVLKEGTFNEEAFQGIAKNLIPDHLALLPNSTGACSWDDGCGVRVNHKQMKDLKLNELTERGFTVSLVANAAGYKQQMNLIQEKLNGMDNASKYHFLEEMYDDHFIYQIGGEGKSVYLKQDYTFNENDAAVEFAGQPMEVKKQITFNNLKIENMVKTEGCLKKVDALIANESTHFTDKDKEWLSAMTDDQLDKLIPIESKPAGDQGQGDPGGSATDPAKMDRNALKEGVTAIFNESKNSEEFIDTYMPEGLRDQMKSGLKMYNDNRQKLVEAIVANSDFKAESLEKWTDTDLQILHNSVVDADFSGTSSPGVLANGQPSKGMEAMFGTKEEEQK